MAEVLDRGARSFDEPRASSRSRRPGAEASSASSGSAPASCGSASCGSAGAGSRAAIARAGSGPASSRHFIHSTTVVHVDASAVEPTTMPKCPASSGTSYIASTRGAARRIPRTAAGRPISSRRPTKYRIGQVRSASVTAWPSITNPPDCMRLPTISSSTNLRNAGPGHATNPWPPRNSRLASRFSSAWRSCRLRTKSTSCASSLRADSRRNPVDVTSPGSPSMRASGHASAARSPATSRSVVSSPIRTVRCRSTGLPIVITDASPRERRNAAAW